MIIFQGICMVPFEEDEEPTKEEIREALKNPMEQKRREIWMKEIDSERNFMKIFHLEIHVRFASLRSL